MRACGFFDAIVFETLLDHAQSEAVRLRAAVEILDRARIRSGIEVRPLPFADSPAVVVEQRLSTLGRRLRDASNASLPVMSD